MDERGAILRRILEEPDEDTHRLVFADWLEENGEPERAEFIRLTVDLARRERAGEEVDGGSPEAEREIQLWEHRAVYDSLCAGLPPDALPLELLRNTSRGFVSEIHLPTAAFLEHAATIFRAHPVTRVVLKDRKPAGGVLWYGAKDLAHAGPHDRHWIPHKIASLMPENRIYLQNAGFRHYRFDTEAETLDALSTACVAYGRSEVGLPPLPTRAPPTLG